MNTKTIEKILTSSTPHFVGDGFRVQTYIPSFFPMERTDPFIMLDYNAPYYFPPTDQRRGVGVHPHKGFETVTIAYKGRVEHGDSSGGGGIIGEGDVQWMTAGNGILHSEFHETEWSKQGGVFQMVQLWVNLPARDKSVAPKYQAIKNSDIPKVSIASGRGTVEVIAGEFEQTVGRASTFSPIHLYNVTLVADAEHSFVLPENYNTMLIVLEGKIGINEADEVPNDHFVLFRNDGETFSIKALEQAKVLILSGEPIAEPIAAHGSFVMNTRAELVQAFKDFQDGKFGELH